MDTVYFYFWAGVSDAAVNKSARVRPGQRFRLSGTLLGVELLAVRLGGWRAEGPPPFSAAAARAALPQRRLRAPAAPRPHQRVLWPVVLIFLCSEFLRT